MTIRWTGPLAAGALVAAACGGSDTEPEAPESPGGAAAEDEPATARQIHIPEVDPGLCDPADREEIAYDLNRDGEPNMWELYATVREDGASARVLTCVQADFDGDGAIDYVTVYDEEGNKIAEEIDLGFDGAIDVRAHYHPGSGRLVTAERATEYGGEADVWERYDDDGNLELVERDRRGDGAPDMWEKYEEGQLTAILYDDTADGRVDRREEAPREADAPAADAASDFEGEADAIEETLEDDLEDAEPIPEAR